jgi:hypothetical protein
MSPYPEGGICLRDCLRKIAQSMRISAGAAVSGWGQEGNVNVDILNRSEVCADTHCSTIIG